jgi:predicted transglutaminase-like cysteine proteinase
MEVYKVEDYWATPLEFMGHGAGDCEDFAIAKYMTLRILGIPNERLRLIYVRYQSGGTPPIAHMVLGFYAQPTEEPVILDNMVTSVRPASMRPDLSPVYSFNSDGLWVGGATTSTDPTTRLSRWRDVLERMHQDGL